MTIKPEEPKAWTVALSVDQQDGETRATARLMWNDRDVTGVGLARCNPSDRDVPVIGDELAVARALSDLARRLFERTATDIEDVTHEHVVSLR